MSVDWLIIVCDIHGPMKYRFQVDQWECPGFEGDWCSTLVKAETLARKEFVSGEHYESIDFYPGEDRTIPKSTWHMEIRIEKEKDEWMQ